MVLDLLVHYLPELFRPNHAPWASDPLGCTLPLLQRKVARELAQRLQWPAHLIDVLVTHQAMGSNRVAAFRQVDVATSRGTPTIAFSIVPMEEAAHSLPRLGSSPSFTISISLARQAPSNNRNLQDHLKSLPTPPPLGAALPELGFQCLDPRLEEWANSRQ